MFWLKSFLTFAIIALMILVGGYCQNILARQRSPILGLLLPVAFSVVAVVCAIPYFQASATVNFSILSFLASVALFVLYALPAVFMWLLLVDIRTERARKERSRAESRRRVRRNLARESMNPGSDRAGARPEDRSAGARSASANRATDQALAAANRSRPRDQVHAQTGRRPVSERNRTQPAQGQPSGRQAKAAGPSLADQVRQAKGDRYAGIDRPRSFSDTLPQVDRFRSSDRHQPDQARRDRRQPGE
ncbi:hypothetical protein ACKQTC_06885 [Peptococcus simiae]|uniref:Uncharacterized protein n=1 Tax=Peptococcus simiae TaxID=1643805 RepID=A0ABW9GZU0_9FIRM